MAMRKPEPDLEADLARLEAMDAASLRREFASRRGGHPPLTASGRFLRHVLAHDAQLAAHGGEDKAVTKAFEQIGAALAEGTDPETALAGRSGGAAQQLTPGAKLLRDYRGTTHEVTVADDGFVWRGRRWRSLSAIAREITGQQRNGPAFFGLTAGTTGSTSSSGATA